MSDEKPDTPSQQPKPAQPEAAKPKNGLQSDGSWRIPLSRPLETHEGPRKELVLQEPSGAMMLRQGLPWHNKVRPDAAGDVEWIDVEYDAAKMAAYLESMTGLDQMTLETIRARDLRACFDAIFHMLQPAGN